MAKKERIKSLIDEKVSRPRESHPQPLSKPYVSLSTHTASAIQISRSDSKTPVCEKIRVAFVDILQPYLSCFDSIPEPLVLVPYPFQQSNVQSVQKVLKAYSPELPIIVNPSSYLGI